VKDSILDLETLLRVPYVDPDWGFDISPDSGQVAFAWNPTGQWEIYVVPLSGDPSPRQVTTGPGAKFAPRWSPGGRWLAYVVDLNGGEVFDIYVCDLATGQHSNLTPETPAAIQPSFCWSPDGSKIAFISDRSGCFDTYVMDVRPAHGLPLAGEPRLMLSLPHPDWEVDWSPDGRWLAVTVEAAGQDYWTAIVPVKAHRERAEGPGEPRLVTDLSTGSPDHPSAPICAKDACWSPDSTRIAFSSDLHGFYNVGIYELKTGRVTWVTEGEGDKDRPAWSPDGQRLACVASDGPVAALAVLDLRDGSLATHQVEPGVYYQPRFTPNGEHLVFVFDNPRHPDELWTLSAEDGSFRQLTRSLPPDLGDGLFVMPAEVRYPSMDGQTVPGLLYMPRHTEELPPAVVTVHGGPTWLTQVTWDPLIQHMVSRGWIVLAPNYRGSTGYGREWQLASRFDFGGGETLDVVAAADYLAREGLADPARIAVTGTSWGGYLTMTSLTQYPDRWAAGSAVVPFLNWFTCHANSREDLQHWDVENFGDPLENHSLYYERSPFFFLDRIIAPVQLVCGAHDVRCPASESTQARDELLARGKGCDFVLYEDEGHGFLKTENVVDAKLRRVAFLDRVFHSETKKVDRLFATWEG
jgi:dipeptidyl aminopeptidase/acylaminoacyl peptidase